MQRAVSPELHANIEVVKEVPSKRHAILRRENSMDPACRGRKNTDFVTGRSVQELQQCYSLQRHKLKSSAPRK